MKTPLALAGESNDPPLYTGDIEADIRTMNARRAQECGGKLSYPSKLDVAAHGIFALRCQTGSKLRKVLGSTCESCYAFKGTFAFATVRKLLEDNYQKIFHPLHVPALAALIRWQGDPRFRMFMSGDIQGGNHFLNILQITRANPETVIWCPTREAVVVRKYTDLIPDNLKVRLSAAMIDGPPPKEWKYTSTVVSDPEEATCPTSLEGGNCGDHGCTACWTDENVAYAKH